MTASVSNLCTTCGEPCPFGVGLQFEQQHPVTRKWITWRMCRPCATREGELADERALKAIEVAERAGA